MRLPYDGLELANVRDLGGLPTHAGGVTRRGLLYRSDAPAPGDRAPGKLIWPPRLVLDLRTAEESAKLGGQWDGRSEVVAYPLHELGRLRSKSTVTLEVAYMRILADASHRLAHAVTLAARGPWPVLVHCAAGKDRTGLVIAALLLASDVTPDAVVADYMATAERMDFLHVRWRAIAGREGKPTRSVAAEYLRVTERGIRQFVEIMVDSHGGPHAWLAAQGADTGVLESWARRFVGNG